MSFATASTKAEDVKQGGSNYINSSGCYPVHVIAAIANKSRNGSTSVDFYVEYQGQKQMLYGNLRTRNNDDSPNKIGSKILNQLIIIAALEKVDDPVEHELPIGKKEAMKTAAVLEDLSDLDVVIRIQMEYGKYNGNFTEKKVIKAFFRAEDNATAEEIFAKTEPGAGYEREQKYVDNVTYSDGVTEAQIEEWIKAKRPEGTAGEDTTKEAPEFGKKRTFGSK